MNTDAQQTFIDILPTTISRKPNRTLALVWGHTPTSVFTRLFANSYKIWIGNYGQEWIYNNFIVIAKNFEINQNHRLRWQSLPSPMNPSLQMHLYWPGPVYSHFALSLHNILFLPSSSLLASVTLIEFSLFPFASGAAVVVKLYSVHKLIGKHLSRPSEISAR